MQRGEGASWRALPLRVRNAARRLRLGSAPREVSEEVWRQRGGDDWVDGYWSDHRSRRRDELVDAISTTFGEPASVLEVGCNAGPNLRRIAQEFPRCRLSGFDINAAAIAGARQRFAESDIPVELSVGSFYEVLSQWPSKSSDLVISSFALAYATPADLPGVLADIVRIATAGAVLVEPTAFGSSRPAGVLTVPWYDWRHDYANALVGIGVGAERVTVFDRPEPGGADSGLVVIDLR